MAGRFVHFLIGLLAFSAVLPGTAWASEIDHLVTKHSAAHGIPPDLVRRVIHIETRGNPTLVSKGNYGLMQIRLGTARAMGYQGDAQGLLDADTNMTYAVRYLAGAYRAAGGNHEQAIRNYQRGYYDRAKAQGFSPYTYNASVPPQAAAPDPVLLRQQQEAERRKAAEMQRVAALETRIEQQKIAEQTRMAQRRAEQEARLAQEQAAKQAREARRQAQTMERTERQNARQQMRLEQQEAAQRQRAEQRQAMLQQRLEREQAQQQQQQQQRAAATEQARQVAMTQPSPRPVAAAPASGRQPNPSAYSWYNPMRFFSHPMHQSHPYQRDR